MLQIRSVFLFNILFLLLLIISCKEQTTEPSNHSPTIESLQFSKSPIKENEITGVSCNAFDQDGDKLNYEWKSNDGRFSGDIFKQNIAWKAPDKFGKYKIEVFVNDGIDTVKGSIEIEVILVCSDSVINYSGKKYHTVKIGEQCWLKENLNVGNMIISQDTSDNQKNNNIIEKYCYENDEENCTKYGGLYQWDEAMQYTIMPQTQGICPDGWHIPDIGELSNLKNAVNSNSNILKAKSEGTGEGVGTDTYGFSALLAGYRAYIDGKYQYLSRHTNYWSSSDSETYTNEGHFVGHLWIEGNSKKMKTHSTVDTYGFSIRCIKNN